MKFMIMSKRSDKSEGKKLKDMTVDDEIDALFGDEPDTSGVITPVGDEGGSENPRTGGAVAQVYVRKRKSATKPHIPVSESVLDPKPITTIPLVKIAPKPQITVANQSERIEPEPSLGASPVVSVESDESDSDGSDGETLAVMQLRTLKRKTEEGGKKPEKKAKIGEVDSDNLCYSTESAETDSLCYSTESESEESAMSEVNLSEQFSERFFYEVSSVKFLELEERKLVPEMPTHLLSFKECKFRKYLKQLGLTVAATSFVSYDKALVTEFYANIQPGNLEEGSPWFNKVYIRGQIVSFTTEMIREHLGLEESPSSDEVYPQGVNFDMNAVAMELSGNLQQDWPMRFKASWLSLKYFLLYKVAVTNWAPSLNVTIVTEDMAILLYCLGTRRGVNLALWIHRNMVHYPLSLKTTAIPHPCLITALLHAQGVERDANQIVHVASWIPASNTLRRKVMDLPWVPEEMVDSVQARLKAIEVLLAELRPQQRALELKIRNLEAEKQRLIGPVLEENDEEENARVESEGSESEKSEDGYETETDNSGGDSEDNEETESEAED